MIKFKNITIKNFLSYGEKPTEINLDTTGTTLIVGEDLDNTSLGTSSNGCGKSVLINALIYGLYGKPISNISLDNLVNNINKKNMLVEVEFEKNNKIVTVRRARKEKGSGNYAKVFVRSSDTNLDEDVHDKTPDSINNINDFIVDLLGIPFELFVRIVAFTATHTPFLDLPVRHTSQANQSDIMEELFRLTQLSVKAESLKAEIKDTKQTLEIKIKHNDQLEKEYERYNKQLESATNRVNDWEEDRKDGLLVIKNELTEHESISIKEQEKLYDVVDKLKTKLITAKEKQKEIESLIIKNSAEHTIKHSDLKQIKEKRDKIVEWKENNTKLITKYKQYINDVPDVHIIDKQTKIHESLNKFSKKEEEFIIEQRAIEEIINKNINAIDTFIKELTHLEDAQCPYCLQKYENADVKIKECKNSIDKLSQEKNEDTKVIKIINKEIKKLKDNIKNSSLEIKYTINELEEFENSRSDYVKILENLTNETCPYGDNLSIGETNDLILILKEDADSIKENISKESNELVKIDSIINNINEKLENSQTKIIISSLNELYEIKNKIEQCKTKIKDLKKSINPYIEPLEELENIKLEPIDMNSINKLNNLITHQNYLIKLLTKKDSFIRKTLLNKNITFLNQRLQHYLSALGLPHKVQFTHEMTANISQFGRILDFGNLSSGQKARVNIGLSFSFRDVLQKSHDSINVCMLDEVLDVGLDSVGVQNAARMLKRKARDEDLALYIISHRDEVSNIFDNRMIIQMEKGFSSVKIEV